MRTGGRSPRAHARPRQHRSTSRLRLRLTCAARAATPAACSCGSLMQHARQHQPPAAAAHCPAAEHAPQCLRPAVPAPLTCLATARPGGPCLTSTGHHPRSPWPGHPLPGRPGHLHPARPPAPPGRAAAGPARPSHQPACAASGRCQRWQTRSRGWRGRTPAQWGDALWGSDSCAWAVGIRQLCGSLKHTAACHVLLLSSSPRVSAPEGTTTRTF